MKKCDLKCGNIVETRNGDKYLLYDNDFLNLAGGGYLSPNHYNEDLTSTDDYTKFDIMKVYKDFTCKELLWERKEKPKLTEDEKVILKNVDKDYKWIARDKDGTLSFHYVKPHKEAYFWSSLEAIYVGELFPNLFRFIKREDEEPYSIEELLGED